MPRIEESVFINCSPEDVWAFLSQPENLAVYSAAIQSAEADGEMGVGTRVSGTLKFLGKRMDYVNEITAFDAPKTSSFKSVDAPFEFHGSQRIEPEGSGTRYTSILETGALGGFFGKLGDPVVAKMYGRQVRSDLENLKEILEAET